MGDLSICLSLRAMNQIIFTDIVNNCNDKLTSPDSTISISSQQIMPSPSSTAGASNSARPGMARPGLRGAGVLLGLGVVVGSFFGS